MEEDRYKRTDDNQTISTPRAEDPIPGTFQVVDDSIQVTDDVKRDSVNEVKIMIIVKKQLQNLLYLNRIV